MVVIPFLNLVRILCVSRKYKQAGGQAVLNQAKDDNKLALSMEDILFLKIMDKKREMTLTTGSPHCNPMNHTNICPINQSRWLSSFFSLQRNISKPEMQKQYVAFMEGIFTNGHAEVAPPLREDGECWYLPLFGVHPPQKSSQIRVVFDSSAQYSGIFVLLKNVPLQLSQLFMASGQ